MLKQPLDFLRVHPVPRKGQRKSQSEDWHFIITKTKISNKYNIWKLNFHHLCNTMYIQIEEVDFNDCHILKN